jgi:acetyl-CoA acyltransferase
LDLIEIHEAFAAQVLSNLKCFSDDKFFQEKLGREKSLGEVDPAKLNVWGSSLAYGHPFAATGGRMIITLLQALEETNGKYGLATACAAGGLGAAMIVERD